MLDDEADEDDDELDENDLDLATAALSVVDDLGKTSLSSPVV